MRKTVLISIVGLALAATAFAQASQEQGKQHQWKGGGQGRMFQGLNLTTDQQAKIQTIHDSRRSQMQALRANASLSAEEKNQQARGLRQSEHQQLLAILTPEQQAQLKQHRQQMGRGFHAGRGFQALNLTDQQKADLKPILESTRQQMQALRSDTSLTKEQKHAKMKEIRQNQLTQMKSILTPEQQQQMQQMRNHRRHHGTEKPSAAPNGF